MTTDPQVPAAPEPVHTIDPGSPTAPGWDPETVISPRNPTPPAGIVAQPDPDAPLDLSGHVQFTASRPEASAPFNVLRDKPHFLRTLPDGDNVCGGDGEPWPCSGWQELHPEQRPTVAVDLETAARVAGMAAADFQRAYSAALLADPPPVQE